MNMEIFVNFKQAPFLVEISNYSFFFQKEFLNKKIKNLSVKKLIIELFFGQFKVF